MSTRVPMIFSSFNSFLNGFYCLLSHHAVDLMKQRGEAPVFFITDILEHALELFLLLAHEALCFALRTDDLRLRTALRRNLVGMLLCCKQIRLHGLKHLRHFFLVCWRYFVLDEAPGSL